jgi:uncharacterized protein involved in outer membrane biogenesis
MKKFIFPIALLVFLIGGIGLYLKSNLDGLIKDALEQYGSAATQTDVDIDSVKISLTSGEGTVNGISVGNPKSYIAAKAVSVENVTLHLDTHSIADKGPVIIRSLTIDRPDITYEVGANGHSNLQTLQDNVSKKTNKKAKSAQNETSTFKRKVIIKDLYIRNGQISITHALLKDKKLHTALPLIHLRNIGKEGEGVTPQEIAKQVLGSLAAQAKQAGSRALTQELGQMDTKSLGDKISKTLNGILRN